MLALPSHVKVFVCAQPKDLRNGFEGLSAKAEALLPKQLFAGVYFAFFNKAAYSNPEIDKSHFGDRKFRSKIYPQNGIC
jgi:hypothetical protein